MASPWSSRCSSRPRPAAARSARCCSNCGSAPASTEIEQVDQATIPPRAFMKQFQITPWRIVDLADPDTQMYSNFKTGSPVALANYSNLELDKLLDHARNTADQAQRIDDYCA